MPHTLTPTLTLTPGWTAQAEAADTAEADLTVGFHEATRLTPARHHQAVRPTRRPSREQAEPGSPLEFWHLREHRAPGLEWLQEAARPEPLFGPTSPVELYTSLPQNDGTWTLNGRRRSTRRP
jgi:hypothetical protein